MAVSWCSASPIPSTFLQFGLDGNDTTFSGIITGAGSLEKTGTGIQTLTGVGSAIGGDLVLCVCGGSGGLVVAGGTFDAGGDIEMFDSSLSVTLGGILRQLDPNQGIDIDTSTVQVSGAGSKLEAAGTVLMFDSDVSVTQGGALSQLDPDAGIAIDESGVLISGVGSKVVAGGSVVMSDSDLEVSAGGLLQQNQARTSFGIFGADFSDVLVSGAGSKIVAGGTVFFVESGLSVTAGGQFEQTAPVSANGLFLANSSDLLVTGAGSKILAQGPHPDRRSTPTTPRCVSSMAAFSTLVTVVLVVGDVGVSTSVLVSGAGSLWTIGKDLQLGCPCGPVTLSIAERGVVQAAGDIVIAAGSTLQPRPRGARRQGPRARDR